MTFADNVLDTIGKTPLVRLRRVVPSGCAQILVKVEGRNPTGSMKDRMAQAVIEAAERDGRLQPGWAVVEYSGGSTGASLALVCAAKGYPIRIFSSDAFSPEKLIQMGQELWDQAGGEVDAFVHSIGTSASLQGVAAVLRRNKPEVMIVAVEPAESAVLSGGPPGAHKMEGIGIGYTPPLWRPGLVDEIIPISTAESEAMAVRLAEEEGLFAGTTSGGNVVAAIRLGLRLGPRGTVATLLVDSGLRYLDTFGRALGDRVRRLAPA